MRLVLHFAKSCRLLFTIFLAGPYWKLVPQKILQKLNRWITSAEDASWRGRTTCGHRSKDGRNGTRLRGCPVTEVCNSIRRTKAAPRSKRILESWGVHEIEINDANAGTIRSAIRGTLNRNRAALLNHKRVETLIAVGKTTQAAKIISDARKVKLTGESRDQQRRILNDLNLEREALNKANNWRLSRR